MERHGKIICLSPRVTGTSQGVQYVPRLASEVSQFKILLVDIVYMWQLTPDILETNPSGVE